MSISREETLNLDPVSSTRNSFVKDEASPYHPGASKKGDRTDIETLVFSEHDPEDPKNWSLRRKVGVVVILCILVFIS